MKQTIFSTIILLTVSGCAVNLPEDELSSNRNKLEYFLQNAEMTQGEMNIISANVLQLTNMERPCLNTVLKTNLVSARSKKHSTPTGKHGKNGAKKKPQNQALMRAAP